MTKPRILGISASLRNARRKTGNSDLINELCAISSQEELFQYLEQEASFHLENFKQAGRTENLPFNELYKNLRKQKGNKGLSNSEVALASALWSAYQVGAEIDHLSLSEYFTTTKKQKNIDELKQKIIEADGFIISTPVYFGDRGSLAQTLLEMIRQDEELRNMFKDKVYGGLTVGAKRNGGQETTLIYQLLDMINCNAYGVGNDSETTSQYGGTGLAGDIGTMPQDEYGLKTSMGTGRRVAHVANIISLSKEYDLKDKHKVAFWILQDKNKEAVNYVNSLVGEVDNLHADIFELDENDIVRCLACDICPTHIAIDEEYRCIIKNDDFSELHRHFMDYDAIIPVAYSSIDTKEVNSCYQQFIERTRYLRRGDYILSDLISTPIIIEEIGAAENMHIRMITSMIRHHTVIVKPLIAYKYNDVLINKKECIEQFKLLNQQIRKFSTGRIASNVTNQQVHNYNPVGYILSAVKDAEDEKLKLRGVMIDDRISRQKKETENRIENRESS